ISALMNAGAPTSVGSAGGVESAAVVACGPGPLSTGTAPIVAPGATAKTWYAYVPSAGVLSTKLVAVPGSVATVDQLPVAPVLRWTTYPVTPEEGDAAQATCTAPAVAGVAVTDGDGSGGWAPWSWIEYAVAPEPTIEIWSSPMIRPATIGSLVRSIVAACLGCTDIVCRPLWNVAETPEPPTTVTRRGRTVE